MNQSGTEPIGGTGPSPSPDPAELITESLAVPSPPPPAGTVLPPQHIGPYRILEPLGEGGMGAVYKAEQRTPVRRIVAIKLIKPGHDTAEVIARFESERQALARMDHPGIAKVLDGGADDERGRPYFVMEHVPGVPITVFADEQKLTIRQRLELFTQACDAIAHAHTKALIHRDIKASNVLAYVADGKPRVKVIDFGIAKALTGDRLTDRTFNTDRGQALGTVESMSPEQADGSPDIDTRTDVYALGVLLYELLTGVKPFDRAALARAADGEVRRMIREVDPPRPSTRLSSLDRTAGTRVAAARQQHVEALARQLRSELEWVPLKAMRKERDRRYASVAELSADIANYLAGRPLIAGPESRVYRLRKFARRNRASLATAAAFVFLLAGAAAFYIHNIRAEQRRTELALTEAHAQRAAADAQRQRADRQRAEAERQEQIATAVRQFLGEMLASADPKNLLGEKVTVLEAIQAAVRRLDAGESDIDALTEASIRVTIGNTLHGLSHYAEAEPNLRRALDLRRKALPPDHPEIAAALGNLAMVVRAQGGLAEAETLFREAADICRRSLPADDPLLATGLNNLASLLSERGEKSEAEKLFRAALDIRRRKLPAGDPLIAASLSNLALLLNDRGKPAEAEPMLREALEIQRTALPAGHPGIAVTLSNLALVIQSRGNLADAEPLYREALAIDRAALPAVHPDIATCLSNLALLLKSRGNLDDAGPMLREALTIRRAALPPGHADIAESLANLAFVLHAQGKLSDAEPLYREALDTYRKVLPADDPLLAKTLNNLAVLLQNHGKPAAAETMYREALAINRRALPPGHPNIITGINSLATLLQMVGKPAEAEPLYREVLGIYRRNEPVAHRDLILTFSNLAFLLNERGETDEAERLYRELLTLHRKSDAPATDVSETARALAALLDRAGRDADADRVRNDYGLRPSTRRPSTRPRSTQPSPRDTPERPGKSGPSTRA